MFSISISLVLFSFTICSYGQRLPPGVPPQQYQQQVPQYQQQQYQHVPQQQQVNPQMQQQYQQMPAQQQQMHHQPQQQMHHPQPPQQQVHQQQQQAHHQPHGHHSHGQPGQILNTANIAQEREHIAEHIEIPIDTSKMSEQELQFHYFKMHDADNNNKLDGCELIKSLIHWHEQGSKEEGQKHTKIEEKIFKDEELVTLIDPILNMDDTNHDGFIDYPEFIRAQQKAAANNPKVH